MSFLKSKPLTLLLPVCAIVAIYFGVRGINSYWVLRGAEKDIQSGHGALASERLEPFRDRVTIGERGCLLYLRSNFMSHRLDRLQWGAESCAAHGIDMPEVTVALASAKEAGGEMQEAVNILIEAAPRYKGSAAVYMKLFGIMRDAKNDQGSRFALLKAVDQAPDDAKAMWAALQYFASQSQWEDAKQMAVRLKDLPGANQPEVKFMIAQVFLKAGDVTTALTVAEQAKGLIATKPELQERFKREFPDLFGAGGQHIPGSKPAQADHVPPPGSGAGDPPPQIKFPAAQELKQATKSGSHRAGSDRAQSSFGELPSQSGAH